MRRKVFPLKLKSLHSFFPEEAPLTQAHPPNQALLSSSKSPALQERLSVVYNVSRRKRAGFRRKKIERTC